MGWSYKGIQLPAFFLMRSLCVEFHMASETVDSNASLNATMPIKRKSVGGADKGSKEKAAKVTEETLQEQPYIPKCVAWFPACSGTGPRCRLQQFADFLEFVLLQAQ